MYQWKRHPVFSLIREHCVMVGIVCAALLFSAPSFVSADESEKEVLNCPCDIFSRISLISSTVFLVHATVESVEDDTVSLIAIEQIKKGDNEYVGIFEGDTFGGTRDVRIPCGGEMPIIAPEDEVLALFAKGGQDEYPTCEEYKECTLDKCGPEESPKVDETQYDRCDGDCVSETVDACALHREEAMTKGNVAVIPWGDSLILRYEEGTPVSIPADQVTDLRDACESYFPDLEPEPDNSDESVNDEDTNIKTDTTTDGCAVIPTQIQARSIFFRLFSLLF